MGTGTAAKPYIDDAVADVWRVLPHTFAEVMSDGAWQPFKFLVFISWIISDAIAKGRGRILLSVPPQHGKSELVSHWLPVQYLNLHPEKNIILASYEADFASTWGRKVRDDLHHNNKSWTRVSRKSSSVSRWETVDMRGLSVGGGMITCGIGGPVTGRGGDLILVDDPHKNWQEANSETYRRRAREWFDGTLYHRQRSEQTTFIVICTRWHREDLVGYLSREHSDKWTVIRLPAIAEENDPMGRKVGEALCPERFRRGALICDCTRSCDCETIKKAVGSKVWGAVYQQDPRSDEGSVVRRQWWRYWESLPAKFDEVILSWDLAFKDNKESSYVVGQAWGKLGADKYLIDQVRDRMNFTATAKAIAALSAKWKGYRHCLVEDKANGPAIIDHLRRQVHALKPVQPRGSKLARAEACAPQIESGNIYIPSPQRCAWVNDYIEEWATFPNDTTDQVDASTQAIDHLTSKAQYSILWSN